MKRDINQMKAKNKALFSVTILLSILVIFSITAYLIVDSKISRLADSRDMVYLAERYEIYERGQCINQTIKNQDELENLQAGLDYEAQIRDMERNYEEQHEEMGKMEYLLRPREDMPAQYIKLVYAGSDALTGEGYYVPMTRYYFSIYDERDTEDSLVFNTQIDDVDGDMRLFLCQQDFNQDGYMDLQLVRSVTDRERDIIYFWNPDQKQYKESTEKYSG